MLLDLFREHLEALALPPVPALVAVSGGPDSVALLDLLVLAGIPSRAPLTVVHVDHGIHSASGDAEALTRRLAAANGLAYECVRLALGSSASETEARAARYAAIDRVRNSRGAELVFLGHHADDQAETVLMRVLRGTGPAGLAGIAPRAGPYVRPLLPFRRAELAEHLARRDLATWTDPANRDVRHLRSWLREVLLPQAETRLPDVHERLHDVARQAARNRRAWSEVLEVLPGLDVTGERAAISVAAGALAGYDSALGAAVLIALGQRAGCTIGEARARRVLRLVRSGRSGSSVPLGGGWKAELAFDRLRLVPPTEHAEAALELDAGTVSRWGRWTISVRADAAPHEHPRAAMSAWFPAGPLEVRALRPGDRISPVKGSGHRLLVRCFQEARVPRSRRAAWPIVESNGVVVWVPGVSRSGALIPTAGSEAVRVDVSHD